MNVLIDTIVRNIEGFFRTTTVSLKVNRPKLIAQLEHLMLELGSQRWRYCSFI